ncbi:MAG: hypothetical protein IT579_04015 [Verrucomicrobia subdivision 3 bacterium]|nr:hypothetical protein [Limisphaerales bacterium]
MSDASWVNSIERRIQRFCRDHALAYKKTERELSASFEIGCLHLLTNNYSERGTLELQNLDDGSFKYLTTPAGNPNNFSWIKVTIGDQEFQLRQQVRIRSHLDNDIAFTPDIVVLLGSAVVNEIKDKDFANGKKRFFNVTSDAVVAAHECKSLVPFPELLISFIGALIAAHTWFDPASNSDIEEPGDHLAPTLFVGGSTNAIQRRMVKALERVYPINILTGLHDTQRRLENDESDLRYISLKSAGHSGTDDDGEAEAE